MRMPWKIYATLCAKRESSQPRAQSSPTPSESSANRESSQPDAQSSPTPRESSAERESSQPEAQPSASPIKPYTKRKLKERVRGSEAVKTTRIGMPRR